MTKIGPRAFYDTALTEINIPSSVTKIGREFIGGTKVESIVIPPNVESDCSIFNSAASLKKITILSPFAFPNIPLKTLILPDGVSAYASGSNYIFNLYYYTLLIYRGTQTTASVEFIVDPDADVNFENSGKTSGSHTITKTGTVAEDGKSFDQYILTYQIDDNITSLSEVNKTLPKVKIGSVIAPFHLAYRSTYADVYTPDHLVEYKPSSGQYTEFTFTVTSVDGAVTNPYTLTITRKEADQDDGTITVKFTFTGDVIHYDRENKTPIAGKEHEVQYWIPKMEVKIPEDSTAKYLTDILLYGVGRQDKDRDRSTSKRSYI